MKATQQLKDEHEGIKLMLTIMETICDDLEKEKHLYILQSSPIIKVLILSCYLNFFF
jgi:hemerythrin-like domain-containing protein